VVLQKGPDLKSSVCEPENDSLAKYRAVIVLLLSTLFSLPKDNRNVGHKFLRGQPYDTRSVNTAHILKTQKLQSQTLEGKIS
jgi:hypothetical protein